MGITIDEMIEEINRQIICLTDAGNITKEVLSLELALDIAKKYQKIKEIIKDRDAEIIPEDYDYWYINKIKKVIENKNDNN